MLLLHNPVLWLKTKHEFTNTDTTRDTLLSIGLIPFGDSIIRASLARIVRPAHLLHEVKCLPVRD